MKGLWTAACLLFCFLFGASLIGCSGEKYGSRHAVPEYQRYFVQGGRDLTAQECDRLRALVGNARMSSEELYGPSDIVIYGSNGGQHIAETYSIYLDDRVIYFGYWLDARTYAMADKEVECVRFSRSDLDWLSSIVRDAKK